MIHESRRYDNEPGFPIAYLFKHHCCSKDLVRMPTWVWIKISRMDWQDISYLGDLEMHSFINYHRYPDMSLWLLIDMMVIFMFIKVLFIMYLYWRRGLWMWWYRAIWVILTSDKEERGTWSLMNGMHREYVIVIFCVSDPLSLDWYLPIPQQTCLIALAAFRMSWSSRESLHLAEMESRTTWNPSMLSSRLSNKPLSRNYESSNVRRSTVRRGSYTLFMVATKIQSCILVN